MAVTELSACMPVDLMPGATDPASRSLPQQPLHHCLFPGAAAFNTLNRPALLTSVPVTPDMTKPNHLSRVNPAAGYASCTIKCQPRHAPPESAGIDLIPRAIVQSLWS